MTLPGYTTNLDSIEKIDAAMKCWADAGVTLPALQLLRDALDAKADKINRLSARCESQRLKIDAQEKRIRELEGALREWLDAEDRPSGVWATDLRRVNDIMKRARAALKDAGAS